MSGKELKKVGKNAILKELNQLHEGKTLLPNRRRKCYTKNERMNYGI